MQIIRGPIASAQKVVIYGPEGIGKSTFASQFPDPLFIDVEGSTKQLDVSRLPKPTSWAMLMSQVDYVVNNPSICQTLVIDTADWAEALAMQTICAKAKVDGIEDFGYGKGYVYLAEEFGRLLNRLNDAIERGINIVFTAHAQMRKFEQPGEIGSYDRWELKLQRKTAPLLKEWADMVLFVNYKTIVVNVDSQGATKGRNVPQGGKRVIYTTHSPVWDAKNRHNLPPEIDLDFVAIAHCFPSAPIPPEEPPGVLQIEEQVLQPEPQPEVVDVQAPQIDTDELEVAGVPKPLADLMRANSVTLAEIQDAIADRGYFPADTPFRNYPQDFIDGVLIGAWDQLFAVIEDARLPF